MLSELPNLDDEVSFVVDGGTSVGPIPMRDIIASVGSGQRDPSVLVWWAGATDWIRFDVHETLMSLAAETGSAESLHAVSDLVEPTPEVFEPTAVEPTQAEPALESAAESRWTVPVEQVEPEVFTPEPVAAEPVAEVFDPVEPNFAPLEAVPSPAAVQEPDAFEPAEAETPAAVQEPETFEPAATLTPQQQLAAEPIAADPVTPEPIAAEPVMTSAEQPAAVDDDAFSFNLPVRDAGEVAEPLGKVAITGLFSSGARTEGESAEGAAAPSPDALDAILAARTSLESVGARIEALSSATKRSLTAEEIQSGVDEISETTEAPVAVVEQAPAVQATEEPVPAGSWTAVEAETTNDAAMPDGSIDISSARAELNSRFAEMVAKSTEHQRRIEWVTRVDELLLSACITAIADSGYVAMDLNSRESDHRVLFEHNDDSRRVRLEISPLENVADHLGRHVRFGLSWGRDVSNPNGAFEVVRQQTPEGLVPPGVVTCEADMAESSVSTHVELIMAADDFVKHDYGVDRASLDSSIAAALYALEERWHVLFDSVS